MGNIEKSTQINTLDAACEQCSMFRTVWAIRHGRHREQLYIHVQLVFPEKNSILFAATDVLSAETSFLLCKNSPSKMYNDR